MCSCGERSVLYVLGKFAERRLYFFLIPRIETSLESVMMKRVRDEVRAGGSFETAGGGRSSSEGGGRARRREAGPDRTRPRRAVMIRKREKSRPRSESAGLESVARERFARVTRLLTAVPFHNPPPRQYNCAIVFKRRFTFARETVYSHARLGSPATLNIVTGKR